MKPGQLKQDPSAMTLQELLSDRLRNHHGYFSNIDLAELARLDRLRQVLVRCGSCRFTCAAQYALHLIDIIRADNRDYVRDVSLPASDPAHRRDFRPLTNDPPSAPTAAPVPDVTAHPHPTVTAEDFGGAFDGFTVTSDADPGL